MELLAQALSHEGMIAIAVAAFVAGLVRGFAGFGTAMIFMPIVGIYFGPVEAISILIIMDVIAPIPLVPRAVRDSKKQELLKITIPMLCILPITSFVLTAMNPELFRYIVSVTALVLVTLLMAGVRYRGVLKDWMLYGAGSLGGILGGLVAVPGPPVIMIYMASTSPPKVIRANNFLYLFIFDIAFLVIFALRGLLTAAAFGMALAVIPVYLIGNLIGQKIFDPEKEAVYRAVAYVIIGISALTGLPLWGN